MLANYIKECFKRKAKFNPLIYFFIYKQKPNLLLFNPFQLNEIKKNHSCQLIILQFHTHTVLRDLFFYNLICKFMLNFAILP